MAPIQKSSIVTPGVGPTRRAGKLAAFQNRNHDRAVSTLDNAIQTITLIGNAVPLSVVKGVLVSIAGILDIVKKTFANQDDFQELAEQCQMISLVVWRATSETPELQLDGTIRHALADLKSSVDGIQDAVKAKAERRLGSKLFHVKVNQETIAKWRNELNRFLILFNTELNITVNLKLDKLLAEFQDSRTSATSNSQMDVQELHVLPVQPRIFVGRDDLVRSTSQSLFKCRHTALVGPGGIGKSSIARAVMNDEAIASKFRDRRFFVRFDDMDTSQVNLGTFLDRIARALGFATSANVHNIISRALSTSETLLVLDNAETFLDAPVDAGRIADAIDGFGARLNVAILLTTRTTVLPTNLDWVRLRVPVLEERAACEAFKAYYPSIETSVLTKLLSAIDFHPLSINLLAQAAVQNEWSPQDLATAWNRQRVTLLEAGDGKNQSLAVTIETSLNSLSFVKLGKTVHHLLQIIAFLPQGISKTRLTSIIPRVSDIESCADALCRQSLAYLNGDFITLLAPIRLYISIRYNRDTMMNPFLGEVRSYYAARIDDEKIVGQDNVNIEHVLTHWLKAPENIIHVLRSVVEFVTALTHHWSHPVSLRPVISTLDISRKGIRIFQRSKVLRGKLYCLLAISYLMRLIGQIKEAEETHTEARALALDIGDLHFLALTDYVLAIGYFEQGNYQAAEDSFRTALKGSSRVSTVFRPCREQKIPTKLGMIQLDMIKGLSDAFYDALPSLKKAHGRRCIAYLYLTAGFAQFHKNHLDVAKSCFEEIQAGLDEQEPVWMIGSLGLAEVAGQQHDRAGSKAFRLRLLESLQRVPDQTTQYVNALTALLAGYLAMEGNIEQARELIIPVVRNATNSLSLDTLKCKYLAGMVELTDGGFDKAADYFRATIEDCISFTELLYRARSYRALGEIAVVQQDMVGARGHFEVTTELCKTMGLPTEDLYLDYTCCIPSKKFDGWRLYQEGHTMFNGATQA